MDGYDPLNATFVPALQRPRDRRNALACFHRAQSSAFCSAVNHTRDVTMRHLLILSD